MPPFEPPSPIGGLVILNLNVKLCKSHWSNQWLTYLAVKAIFEQYLSREIGVKQALALLNTSRRRFFELMRGYREAPDSFSLEYKRKGSPHRIDPKAEDKIIKELKKETQIIEDKSNPVQNYNYSYLREILEKKHRVFVSLPTIISRAKKGGFIRKRNSGSRTTVKS